jgi:anti-anti-sigma factor
MIFAKDFGNYLLLEFKLNELDIKTTPKIWEKINKLLAGVDYSDVILDLHNIYYIDSMGLNILISLSKKLITKKSELLVICNSIKILQLFDIIRLDAYIKIFPSIDDAKAYLLSKINF